MAQGRQLPNIENVEDFDALDFKLYEHVRDTPNWTYRSAAQHAGCDVHTAWDRIRRIRRSDFVTAMREDLEELGGKMRDAVDAGLESSEEAPRSSVALRLLTGLGVLVDKSERKLSFKDATPEQIAEAIDRLSDDDLERLIAQRSADSGA